MKAATLTIPAESAGTGIGANSDGSAGTGAVSGLARSVRAFVSVILSRASYLGPILSMVIGTLSLATTTVDAPGGLGLIAVLPLGAWIALAILLATFSATVARNELTGVRAGLHVGALILLLHGAPALMYQEPRFPTAWTHAGFVEYIQRTGSLLPRLDARFSWPGLFTGTAMLNQLAAIKDPVSLLAWFPILANAAYAVALSAISSAVTTKPQTRWLAVWFFLLASWVGQDYFSPQAVNLFLYLTVIGVLLTYFRPAPRVKGDAAAPKGRVRGWLSWSSPNAPSITTSAGQRLGLLGLVLLMAVASDMSHQLTPFMLIGAVTLLAAARRTTLRGLPVLLLLAAFAYISYGAIAFWSGHLQAMFGGLGSIGSSLSANLGDRVRGGGAHMTVVMIRLLLAAVVLTLSLVGLARLKRLNVEPALILLAGFPIGLIGLQSYGGEALLRAYAFSLPFGITCLVIAFTSNARTHPPAIRVAGVWFLSAASVLTFFIARYGNESFEFSRPNEVKAMNWVYENLPEGAIVATYDSMLPKGFKRVEAFPQRYLGNLLGRGTPEDLESVATFLRRGAAGTVVLTSGQEASGIANGKLSDGWIHSVRDRMVESNNFTIVFENADAWVLQVKPAPRAG